MRKHTLPSYEEMSAKYTYDPETGFLYSKRYGCKVGYLNQCGYREIALGGTTYRVHRIAWLLVHGQWPEKTIDHINGDRADNRLINLREASQQQNLQNRPIHKRNKLRVKGVSLHKGKFRAQCWHNGRFVLQQYFPTLEEASAAYQAAAKEVFGEWHRPR